MHKDCIEAASEFQLRMGLTHQQVAQSAVLDESLTGVLPSPGTMDIGSGSSEIGLVEARGVEPLSEDLQHNGSTCLADRFSFAATHAHRLA